MATYHVAATDERGWLTAPSVLAQIDARIKAAMRADLPALADELGIGGGSGIEQVSGTVTLDTSGPAIREFFTTGATTFKANGVDTLISSFTAVVWRRNAQGSWGYQVVQDSWTTPTTTPDTTKPYAGTLASSAVSNTSFTVTVSGASDDRALAPAPYRFSLDNGSTWTVWQASNVYVATGRTASTSYSVKAEVRDVAGNVSQTPALTVTTSAQPANSLPTATLTVSASDLSATATWTTADADGDTVKATVLDWGDGSAPVVNPVSGATHGYVGAGTWTVSLTVSDGKATTTVTKTVTTSNPVDLYPSATIYDTFTAPDGTRVADYTVATGKETQRVTEKGGLKWGRYASVSLWDTIPANELGPGGGFSFGPSIWSGRVSPTKRGIQLRLAQPRALVEFDYDATARSGVIGCLLSGEANKGIHIRLTNGEGLKVFINGPSQLGTTVTDWPVSGVMAASYDPDTGKIEISEAGGKTLSLTTAAGRQGTIIGFENQFGAGGPSTIDNVRVTYR